MGAVGIAIMVVSTVLVGTIAALAYASGNKAMSMAQVANLVSIILAMFNPTCFTADTLVYTEDGQVCIEDVQVGDKVWAYNYETGEIELKEVLNVWVKETDELIHVTTSDGETIDTTSNHPFWVEDEGWVAAGDLDVGDELTTTDGRQVEITDIEIEKLAEPIVVYNLEVADDHTYFIGEYEVLVHNDCYILFNKEHKSSLPNPKGVEPNGKPLQSHHGLQKKWCMENLGVYGYDLNLAPTVTIETGIGTPHIYITNAQNARRNARIASGKGAWSSTLQEELNYIVLDFRGAGYSDDVIRDVLEQQYKMLDKLKIAYERITI